MNVLNFEEVAAVSGGEGWEDQGIVPVPYVPPAGWTYVQIYGDCDSYWAPPAGWYPPNDRP
jgi:hypothetical protein